MTPEYACKRRVNLEMGGVARDSSRTLFFTRAVNESQSIPNIDWPVTEIPWLSPYPPIPTVASPVGCDTSTAQSDCRRHFVTRN